jgi:hypothetical protein
MGPSDISSFVAREGDTPRTVVLLGDAFLNIAGGEASRAPDAATLVALLGDALRGLLRPEGSTRVGNSAGPFRCKGRLGHSLTFGGSILNLRRIAWAITANGFSLTSKSRAGWLGRFTSSSSRSCLKQDRESSR